MVVQTTADGGQSGWRTGRWRCNGYSTAQLGQPGMRGAKRAAWSCSQRRWQTASTFRRPLNRGPLSPN
eukprot:8948110-Lingulodinium_polyedra.AAC.1